jgi:hypothetical protein
MARKSPSSVSLDYNIRANKIYPSELSEKHLSQLKTVGFTLNKGQAIQLARTLLLVTQDWNSIDITCYRFKKRRIDGTYNITITSTD